MQYESKSFHSLQGYAVASVKISARGFMPCCCTSTARRDSQEPEGNSEGCCCWHQRQPCHVTDSLPSFADV